MCVTEVWTYRECGCHYNHSILCLAQRQRLPHFAPSIQYPLEQFLEESGVDADSTVKQLRRRARPAEPHDCPQHTTIPKSFLNQICEDCLLAELETTNEGLEKLNGDLNPHRAPAHHGDASVEDASGDAEVELDLQSPSPTSTASDAAPQGARGSLDADGDHRILESHVEVTVESDSHSLSASADECSSPLFPAPHDHSSSRPSSIAPSLTSADVVDEYCSPLPARRYKRYGLTFPDGPASDFSDADDECELNADRHHRRSSPPLFRGRSLRRKVVEDAETDADAAPTPLLQRDGVHTSPGHSRFRGLRSISSTLRPSSKAKADKKFRDGDAPRSVTAPLPQVKPKSKNPFHSLRSRKSASPMVGVVAAADAMPAPAEKRRDAACDASPSSRPKVLSPPPPRKSSLKNWAFFMFQDFRHSKRANRSRSRSKMRSLAPSPTSSWTRIQDEQHETKRPSTTSSPSRSEMALESESAESSIYERDEASIAMEHAPAPTAESPGDRRSSPLRAAIDGLMDFDLGFGHVQAADKLHPSVEHSDDGSLDGRAPPPGDGLVFTPLAVSGPSVQKRPWSLPPSPTKRYEQAEAAPPVLHAVEPLPSTLPLDPSLDDGDVAPPGIAEGDMADAEEDMADTEPLCATPDASSSTEGRTEKEVATKILVRLPPRRSSLRRLVKSRSPSPPVPNFDFPLPPSAPSSSRWQRIRDSRMTARQVH